MKSLANMRGWMSGQRAPQDGICSMALSPDGSLMITLHWSGRFSVWECPSLKLVQTWELDQQVCCRWSLPLPGFLVLTLRIFCLQPNYDELNTSISENPVKRRMMREHLNAHWLADANWWSNKVNKMK